MVLTIILLLVLGVLLVLSEIIIPGGIVGAVGGLFIAAGIVLAFVKDLQLGVIVLIGSSVFFMVSFWLWLKYLHKIPLAKNIFMNETADDWSGTDEHNQAYLGKEGITQTILRPSGFAIVDDERVDVVTQGGMIEKGEKIKVIEVEGNRIVVERIQDEPESEADETQIS